MTPDANDIPVYVLVLSETNMVLYANQTILDDLQLSEDQVTGHKMDFILPVVSKIFFQTHVLPLLRIGRKTKELFFTIKGSGDPIPCLWNISSSPALGKEVFLFSGMAINNRHKMEKEVIEARRAAESALQNDIALTDARVALKEKTRNLVQKESVMFQQSENLEQFNKVFNHDLQEPIRKLLLYTSILNGESGAQRVLSTNAIIKKISRLSTELQTTIRYLQQLSRLDHLRKNIQQVNIGKLFVSAYNEIVNINERVSVSYHLEGELDLLIDRPHFEFIFSQLLTNLIAGAQNPLLVVHVVLDKFKRTMSAAEYHDHTLVEFGRIRISCQGSLYDQSATEFDLLKGMKAGERGTYGLAMVKKIVLQHRGFLSATHLSELEPEFTIEIPITQ